MAKKNYGKYLPKVGGTVAMTVAMAAALAVPVQATEVDPEQLNQDNTPVVENPAPAAETPAPVSVELPATNEAVVQTNNETVDDNQAADLSNQQTAADNQTVVESNNDIVGENSGITDATLPAPDLTTPEAPEAPETEGLGDEEYNEVVDDYNDQVNDYNNAVDEYNKGVDEYNDAADAYDEEAQKDYEEALKGYEQTVEDRQKEQKVYDEVTLPDWEERDAAYQQYLKDLETYESYLKEYNEVLLPSYQEAGGKAHEETVIAFENYQKAVEDWKANYETYEKEYNIENEAARQEAWEAYIKEYKDAYDAAVKKETDIYESVKAYNQTVTDTNNAIDELNKNLSDMNSNAVQDLTGATNNTELNTKIDAETMKTLQGYQDLVKAQEVLEKAASDLDQHPGKSKDLDSEEYAEYLKAVEDFNKSVAEHNTLVDAYNKAIETYNKAVVDYNAAQEDSEDIFVDTSGNTGTADWGNITGFSGNFWYYTGTLNHIDVKYAAAASMDVIKKYDENGNEIKEYDENGKEIIRYSESVTEYTVTGVYTDKASAEKDPNSFGVSYRNNKNSETQVHVIQKDSHYQEFGNPSHDGASIDPTQGEISFYMTLLDTQGTTYGITVNMDATSAYPENTFYAVENGGKLGDFRYGPNKDQKLEVVTIDGKDYYNISGQSVFVISALTCDGMQTNYGHGHSHGSSFTANGLDLVLNMRTLIEIHKAGNAQKLSYVNWEYEKTAQEGEPKYGEYQGNPEGFEYEDLTFNPPAPPKPGQPDEVAEPEEKPGRPADYEGKAPTAPKTTGRLETLDNKLETLFNKVIAELPPEGPTNPDTPVNPVNPVFVDVDPILAYYLDYVEEDNGNGTVTILDEEVPLAAAPSTGDLSGIWAVISGLSLGGMTLLGRKRKDEEA